MAALFESSDPGDPSIQGMDPTEIDGVLNVVQGRLSNVESRMNALRSQAELWVRRYVNLNKYLLIYPPRLNQNPISSTDSEVGPVYEERGDHRGDQTNQERFESASKWVHTSLLPAPD